MTFAADFSDSKKEVFMRRIMRIFQISALIIGIQTALVATALAAIGDRWAFSSSQGYIDGH
jgi:hypothetical protein